MIYRAASPSFTFDIWESVRENEEKNIFPNIGSCNRTVDSTMPYEIGLLKPYLEKFLREDRDESTRGEAKTILCRLQKVQTVSDKLVGSDSLYREFI